VGEQKLSLRDRTRRAVRAEILEAAMRLFLSQGYEATTIEEIAEEAGISRRSYFRYFVSKDDALAEALTAIGQGIAAALAERPVEEPDWLALRRSFDPLIDQADADPKAEALGCLMLERPVLQQGKDAAWQSVIANALMSRWEHADTQDVELRAQALAAAAITCLHAAQARWLAASEHRSLASLLDITMNAVHPLV
jgi:AcrR family transcriptional regulator